MSGIDTNSKTRDGDHMTWRPRSRTLTQDRDRDETETAENRSREASSVLKVNM